MKIWEPRFSPTARTCQRLRLPRRRACLPTMFGGCLLAFERGVVGPYLHRRGAVRRLYEPQDNLRARGRHDQIGRDALANSGSTNIVYKGSDELEQKLTVIEFVKKVLEIPAVQVGADRRRRLYLLARASFPPCSSSFTFIWMMLLYRGLSRSSV